MIILKIVKYNNTSPITRYEKLSSYAKPFRGSSFNYIYKNAHHYILANRFLFSRTWLIFILYKFTLYK